MRRPREPVPYPLVITGGYAVQANGLLDRLSQDLDVATENPAPMDQIIRTVRAGLTERGWTVREIETDPLSAMGNMPQPHGPAIRWLDNAHTIRDRWRALAEERRTCLRQP